MRAIEGTGHAPQRTLTPAREDPLGPVGQTMPRRAVIPSSVLSPPGLRANPPTPALPSVAIAGPPRPQPKLLDRLREALRSRHYGRRTEQCYCHWACLPRRKPSRRRQVKRFIFFHHVRHSAQMAEPEINAFLTHLAVKQKVSTSTQNQALSALLFLYRHVLEREIGDLGEVIRARKPKRLPVVMTREEVKALLGRLPGDK